LRQAAPPGDCSAFAAGNLRICPLPETGGRGIRAKVIQILSLPRQIVGLARRMRRSDVVHVRCPGNLGLLGVICAPLFARRMIAKYAGQWDGYPGEPWSFRLQRQLLASRWWQGPVTVYGDWPDQPEQIVPFFNSAMTSAQMRRAIQAAERPRASGNPRRLLFVGRLSRAKGADIAVDCCWRLVQAGLDVQLDIAGEGPERGRIEEQVQALGLHDRVRLHGGRSFDEVMSFYEAADLLVLPSETEGWPKVLAEAMAFGVPCVATTQGLNPWILGDGRGLTAPLRDVAAFTAAIQALLLEDGPAREARRKACTEWGRKHSLDDVKTGLRRIMESRWGVELAGGGS
jgi:glycosyltransferase involved in cell wall biosynthesis